MEDLDLVQRLLADRPDVHNIGVHGDVGLLATVPECYRFLADHCVAGARTLETGAGLSTLLFAAALASHDCVTPDAREADRLVEHCRSRGIRHEGLRFHIGPSERVLPALEPTELDLVFLDGNHGFPVAVIDFFFAGGRLRAGGVLVLDDLHLPVPRLVADFCDHDAGWTQLQRADRWGAWERGSSGALGADHFDQPFLAKGWALGDQPFRVQARQLVNRGARSLRWRLKNLRSR